MQEGSPSLAGRPPSFDHVLGDARPRDLKPELEQFAVDAWRAPKRIFDAHPPDQYAQLRVDLRSPSLWARLPTPVAAKAGPVPTHERLGPDDCENLQDRWKPAIQLDKEPAIIVREPDATMQPTLQDNQLMSKHRVLSFKPQLRLEWRGQDGQNETEQPPTDLKPRDAVTELIDDAGAVAVGNHAGEFHRAVAAGATAGIGGVDPGGLKPDPDFARSGHRRRHVAKSQHIRRGAGSLIPDGLHSKRLRSERARERAAIEQDVLSGDEACLGSTEKRA